MQISRRLVVELELGHQFFSKPQTWTNWRRKATERVKLQILPDEQIMTSLLVLNTDGVLLLFHIWLSLTPPTSETECFSNPPKVVREQKWGSALTLTGAHGASGSSVSLPGPRFSFLSRRVTHGFRAPSQRHIFTHICIYVMHFQICTCNLNSPETGMEAVIRVVLQRSKAAQPAQHSASSPSKVGSFPPSLPLFFLSLPPFFPSCPPFKTTLILTLGARDQPERCQELASAVTNRCPVFRTLVLGPQHSNPSEVFLPISK